MKTIYLLLAICVATVASLPQQERIVGGTVTTINTHPFAVSLQLTRNNAHFSHQCGATIINNRSAMSAAHCWVRVPTPNTYRVRSGSTNQNSGGTLHNVAQLFGHPQYNSRNHDNDVGVIRVSPAFQANGATVRIASIAGPNAVLPDNSNVIALGWGQTGTNAAVSTQLRHVTLRSVNQARCSSDFGAGVITANMLCAGWAGGGRSICFGDSGTGLVFNNVVVGISSFIGWDGCGSARWPSVFARVSRYNAWIRNLA